jgi:hypothetical protein
MKDEDDGTVEQAHWVRRYGYITESDIDVRWVLFRDNDPRPHGGLRIVSHPDLQPGYLRSYISIITKRWPKTKEELAAEITDKMGLKYPVYGLTPEEMETYNLDENFETWENSVVGSKRELEKIYGIKVFEA